MSRIASLISSGTEILYALGLGESVVATSHECDFPPEATTHRRVTISNIDSQSDSLDIDGQVKSISAAGGALYDFDRDALLGLRPDVIITQAQCDVCAVRYQDVVDFVQGEPALESTRIIALNPQSLSDVFADVLRVGSVLGVADRAEQYVNGLLERVDAIRRRTAPMLEESRPRVICIEWIEPLMLAANWTPELIDIAGGRCPLTQAGRHSDYSSWSSVVQFDPEVIVVSPCGFDLARTLEEAKPVETWEGFDELTATRSGRVFALDGNAYLNRSGPRLVESVEILAHLFHPKVFPESHAGDWQALA